jgi:hypothetical protein
MSASCNWEGVMGWFISHFLLSVFRHTSASAVPLAHGDTAMRHGESEMVAYCVIASSCYIGDNETTQAIDPHDGLEASDEAGERLNDGEATPQR